MDAPNPLTIEGRDAQVQPPVPMQAAGEKLAGDRRGNADRDKFEQQPALAESGTVCMVARTLKCCSE